MGARHVIVRWTICCTRCGREWPMELPLCERPEDQDVCCPYDRNAALLWVAPVPAELRGDRGARRAHVRRFRGPRR